jgi:signal transduction histidine kinase
MTIRKKTLIISIMMFSALLASVCGIYLLGLITSYTMVAFLVVGVGFLAIFLLFIDRLLLSGVKNIDKLSDIMRDIAENGDISKLISIKGDDELVKIDAAVEKTIRTLQTSQEMLSRSEAKNLAMLNAVPDSICQIGVDGVVEGYKPARDDSMPFLATDVVGKRLSELLPAKIYDLAIDYLQKALQHEAMQSFSYSIYRKDDWHHFEARMIRGSKDIVLMIVRDTTVQQRAETSLKKEKEEVEKKTHQLQIYVNELEAFAYSVSHDLRAPLRSIDGFSQVLLEDYNDKLDEEGKDYLRRVRSASQHMAELIDDLLNLSRVTRCDMVDTKVDLSALAQTIAIELQNSQPERDVQFDIAPRLVVRGDANLLRIALENLLGNAWKFSSRRDHVRIEMGFAENNGRSAYFVRDNGAGFNMDYKHKLFGVFQRLHSDKDFEGTGIGLATVQRIISRHGGTIWAEGAEDRGATFYFRL